MEEFKSRFPMLYGTDMETNTLGERTSRVPTGEFSISKRQSGRFIAMPWFHNPSISAQMDAVLDDLNRKLSDPEQLQRMYDEYMGSTNGNNATS